RSAVGGACAARARRTRTTAPSSYGALYELGTVLRVRRRGWWRGRACGRGAGPGMRRPGAPARDGAPGLREPVKPRRRRSRVWRTRTTAPSSYGAPYELGTALRARGLVGSTADPGRARPDPGQ